MHRLATTHSYLLTLYYQNTATLSIRCMHWWAKLGVLPTSFKHTIILSCVTLYLFTSFSGHFDDIQPCQKMNTYMSGFISKETLWIIKAEVTKYRWPPEHGDRCSDYYNVSIVWTTHNWLLLCISDSNIYSHNRIFVNLASNIKIEECIGEPRAALFWHRMSKNAIIDILGDQHNIIIWIFCNMIDVCNFTQNL